MEARRESPAILPGGFQAGTHAREAGVFVPRRLEEGT